MKTRIAISISAGTLLAALAAPVCLPAQEQSSRHEAKPAHYRVIDLGTLGGTFGAAYGINNSGKAGGGATLANGNQHSFLWTQSGGMHDLGTGGPTAEPSLRSSPIRLRRILSVRTFVASVPASSASALSGKKAS
jgi:probable HAF family extracellular repeat protein